VLENTGLDPTQLTIELTETAIMKNPAEAAGTLMDLKALGVSISMDDFGTGYSSLSMLKRLPIDCLKIDRSFVRDIVVDGDDAAITSTIIAMGKSLKLEVIAEGVEEPEQLAFLRRQGCGLVQGFLVGRPVPAVEIADLLAAGKPLLRDVAFLRARH
jgi:EAL domain-containing protein (putative c-di-GMP-specific phosphodiesterase class I)